VSARKIELEETRVRLATVPANYITQNRSQPQITLPTLQQLQQQTYTPNLLQPNLQQPTSQQVQTYNQLPPGFQPLPTGYSPYSASTGFSVPNTNPNQFGLPPGFQVLF